MRRHRERWPGPWLPGSDKSDAHEASRGWSLATQLNAFCLLWRDGESGSESRGWFALRATQPRPRGEESGWRQRRDACAPKIERVISSAASDGPEDVFDLCSAARAALPAVDPSAQAFHFLSRAASSLAAAFSALRPSRAGFLAAFFRCLLSLPSGLLGGRFSPRAAWARRRGARASPRPNPVHGVAAAHDACSTG